MLYAKPFSKYSCEILTINQVENKIVSSRIIGSIIKSKSKFFFKYNIMDIKVQDEIWGTKINMPYCTILHVKKDYASTVRIDFRVK